MMSFSQGSFQILLPGIQQANSLLSSRAALRSRNVRRSSTLCEQSLSETVRKLECLSTAEVQALASKSVSSLNKLLSGGQKIPTQVWEESVDKACTALLSRTSRRNDDLTSSRRVNGGAGYLLPRYKLFKNVNSPMLNNTVVNRGFKTRRSDSSNADKPFTSLKGGSSESMTGGSSATGMDSEGFQDLLKQLDLPKHEKDKVNIALSAYAAGFSNGKEYDGSPSQSYGTGRSTGAGAGSSGSGSGAEKRRWFEWSRIHNFASILIIIAILISLGQIFNVPALRFSKGGNEIAPEDVEVTFDDVKGCDEAKQELQEVVEFLMNPEKFSSLGGRLPKGCLLVGPPGTGKTLLARAVAGQAGVPFFHASGSEFDEVLVGQGARRVRDLFKAAKARAPCVIFIDEIDSVGSKRTSSVLHPYANQTINQLLSEMDGFLCNEGVVVLGATNRAEDLDRALLRPGRFDTQVTVPNPDIKGRREILQLYLAKIKHDDSVDLEKLAKMTVGFSGADLQNMVNTAAIRAAADGKEWVTMAEFEYSHDKHVLGTDWKSRVREKKDLEITAYHEAGHTLVAYFTKDSNPIHKVTIVAKGQSGGHTAFLPESDAWHVTRAQFVAKMDVAMGGRAAEELVFGKEKITGGASADLESATNIAETMVKGLGMSEKIGLRVFPDNAKMAPGTGDLIDSEISVILNDSYKRAAAILKSHRRELDLLAETLLVYETLDSEDVKCIVDHRRPPPHKMNPSTGMPGYKQNSPSSNAPMPTEPIGSRPVSGVITS